MRPACETGIINLIVIIIKFIHMQTHALYYIYLLSGFMDRRRHKHTLHPLTILIDRFKRGKVFLSVKIFKKSWKKHNKQNSTESIIQYY